MMKNWLNKNYKILIILAFLIPIIIVAVVSISHVTVWYGISNPVSWAMYLSLGVEIAALSALAAISASMGRNVYFPFIIVTIIQFIGNIFFSYQYIDINSKIFKDWVDLVSPLISSLGVEEGDMVGHRRFLALFSGGLLPLISLSFLHMLVKFSEDARLNKHNVINEDDVKAQVDDKIIEEEIKKRETNGEIPNIVTASDIVGEVSKIRLSEDELKKLEEILINPPKPSEELKSASEFYNEKLADKNTEIDKQDDVYDFENEEGLDSEIEEFYDIAENNLTEAELSEVINEEVVENIETKKIEEEIEDTNNNETIDIIPTPVMNENIEEQKPAEEVVNFQIYTPVNQDEVEKKN